MQALLDSEDGGDFRPDLRPSVCDQPRRCSCRRQVREVTTGNCHLRLGAGRRHGDLATDTENALGVGPDAHAADHLLTRIDDSEGRADEELRICLGQAHGRRDAPAQQPDLRLPRDHRVNRLVAVAFQSEPQNLDLGVGGEFHQHSGQHHQIHARVGSGADLRARRQKRITGEATDLSANRTPHLAFKRKDATGNLSLEPGTAAGKSQENQEADRARAEVKS